MAFEPRLQIIISSGPEDSRATLGFAAAMAASACDTPVVVFLVMNGAQWALKSVGNEAQRPGFQPIGEMLELIQSSGGRVEVCSNCFNGVCSTCHDEVCTATPDQMQPRDMREGIHPGGLTSVAVRMSQIPTVTF
jgi:predicted peroxiredoxin